MPTERIYEKRHERRYAERAAKKEAQRIKYDDPDLINFENMLRAFIAARKNTSWKTEVIRYELFLVYNICKYLEEIFDDNNEPLVLRKFKTCERGVIRDIQSIPMKDRVFHHLLCDEILNPYLMRSFIYDNGASLKNKGLSFSIKRFRKHLREAYHRYNSNDFYILKIDLTKYFQSIQHDKLKDLIELNFKTPVIKNIIYKIIDSFDEGLGLGSQVCQILAVAYLSKIDHYIKEVLRVKGYGRYMDDMYLIFKTKNECNDALKILDKKFSEIGMCVNYNKTKVVKVKSESFIYLKKRFKINKNGKITMYDNKNNIKRMRRKLKKFKELYDHNIIELNYIKNNLKSYIGINRHTGPKMIAGIISLYEKLFGVF